MLRFDEHEVVIPIVVVTELEAKRTHSELGYFARVALRLLDDLRVEQGRLDEPLEIGEAGGTLRVELNHTDAQVLPPGFRLGDDLPTARRCARLALRGFLRDQRARPARSPGPESLSHRSG